MYGEDTIIVSPVRSWVCRFKRREKDIGNKPRSGRPAMAAMKMTKG